MSDVREVIDALVASISPASEAQALGVRQRLAAQRGGRELGAVGHLIERLCAARHAPRPALARRVVLCVAADHGIADPRVDLGVHSPAVVGAQHIAAGGAAVNAVARTAGARVVVLDAGVRGGQRWLADGVVDLRLGDGTGDISVGPAMPSSVALLAVQTGIAALLSLADEGLDVLAVGQLAPGAQPVSAAVIAALTGAETAAVASAVDRAVVDAALAANAPLAAEPIALLAQLGGYDLGVLAGLILAAAAISVPVVLDDHGTSAAALIAARLAPAVPGYLIAAHAGSEPSHRQALGALGLVPLFDLGLSHGEGAGAALALPLIDAAARLLEEL